MNVIDRPALDANEIEVTPEMVEAGMEEYSARWLGLRDADSNVAAEMLRAAFLAMYSVLTTQRHGSSQTEMYVE